MDIITNSNISIQKFYTHYFNRNNPNYHKRNQNFQTIYDLLINKYIDCVIEHLVTETIYGESSITKLPDFPPQWNTTIYFNFFDFYYGNENLLNTKSKHMFRPYVNICKEMVKQMQRDIKWALIHYLDRDNPHKDINKMELSYAVFDDVDINTGAISVFFSWRIMPKYWPKYLEYAKKNNVIIQ